MEIVLASGNKKKIDELQALMSDIFGEGVKVLSLSDIGFEGDIIEDGNSFEENAMIKAKAVAALGYIGVGDDSGLMVEALDGAPGIYSARYAGEHGKDALNNEKLLCDLSGKENRKAAFVSSVACAIPGGDSFTVTGRCEGEIIDEYRGDGGFGYDPLFYIPDKDKTFAQLTMAEKNAISHRGRAMRAFAERFKEYLKENHM